MFSAERRGDRQKDVFMAKFAHALAALLIIVGLLWIGQGSGYFPYPAESFMIDQTPWIYWGIVSVAAGLIVIVLAKRKPPR